MPNANSQTLNLRYRLPSTKEKGFVLVSTLVIAMGLSIIGVALLTFSINNFVAAKRSASELNALALAEAGGDNFMFKVNQDSSYTGSSGPVTLYNDSIKGKGTYETTVKDGGLNNEKIVSSVGKVYLPSTSSRPVIRKIRLEIRGVEPFNYAIQSGGNGPLYIYGNTNFSGTKIFTSKYIRIQDNTVSITNSTLMAADKDPTSGYNAWGCSVSGNNHPSGSVLDVAYSVNNSHCGIDTSTNTVTQNDSSVVPQPLPSVDKAGVLASTSSDASCSDVSNTPYHIKHSNYPQQSGGTTCNVSLDKGKTYTLDGNAYIRGNLSVDTDTIVASPSLTSDVYVLVDGTIDFKGNGSSIQSNNNGVAIIFVSYSNIDSLGDKTSPNALTISGNSLSLIARFLAPNGSIGFNGRGALGPLAANTIVLNGSGTSTFVQPTGVPTNPNIWDVKYYQQVYDY